jgi:hypothetical protein
VPVRHTGCPNGWSMHPPLECGGFLALFCKSPATSGVHTGYPRHA